MSMRLLLVEDEQNVTEFLVEQFRSFSLTDVDVTRSRDTAFDVLAAAVGNGDAFDWVICDLRIPSSEGGLNVDESYGLAVYARVRDIAGGVPVLFLTGHGTAKNLANVCASAGVEDLFGSGEPEPLARFVDKADFEECIRLTRSAEENINVLNAIEISSGGAPLDLTASQGRALRIFARRVGGSQIRAIQQRGGLSEATVIVAEILDSHGYPRASVVAKLASLAAIAREQINYSQFVATRLQVGAYPPHAGTVSAGAWATGGLFYRLADGYSKSLFAVLPRLSTSEQSAIVDKIRTLLSPWTMGGGNVVARRIGDIRRASIADAVIEANSEALFAVRWSQAEMEPAQFREVCQHGDLHGANILVNNQLTPVVIDFGDVGMSSAGFDPITLELSLLFHPQGKGARNEWPSVAQAANWASLDLYLEGCPLPGFVEACRSWAFADSFGDRAVYANAYLYAIRQLKYADTDHELAVAVATSAVNRILAPN